MNHMRIFSFLLDAAVLLCWSFLPFIMEKLIADLEKICDC